MKNSFYRFLLYGFIVILFFVMLFSFVFTNKKLTKEISSNVSGFVTKVDSVISVPFTALSNLIMLFLISYQPIMRIKI